VNLKKSKYARSSASSTAAARSTAARFSGAFFGLVFPIRLMSRSSTGFFVSKGGTLLPSGNSLPLHAQLKSARKLVTSCHTVFGFTVRLRWSTSFFTCSVVMEAMGVAAPKNLIITGSIILVSFFHSERPKKRDKSVHLAIGCAEDWQSSYRSTH
jgi:hypothetical protein